ncbi:phosphatidate cytidylyltransferase [Paragonimus westermani]|uniref:phosphatidate cytidylyltransferase n=1 Tax=Paragonimus westermani TaxID=34504 RepID=A0A5J4P2C8_9TREM|nr:phosphatidate cytidylyltransferase [Paragonimus westermani]
MDEAIRLRQVRVLLFQFTSYLQPQQNTLSPSSPPSGDSPLRDVPSSNSQEEDDDDMGMDTIKPDLKAAAKFNQGTGTVPSFIKSITSTLPPRWVNWSVRFFTSILLLSTFSILIYLGPLALVLLRYLSLCPFASNTRWYVIDSMLLEFGDQVLVLQFACFYEIINIGCVVYRSHDLPWFRLLSWYFLFSSNYYLFGEGLITRFRLLLAKEDFLQPLVTYHHFLSFSLYSSGIVLFVLSLVKKHYIKQFTLVSHSYASVYRVVRAR